MIHPKLGSKAPMLIFREGGCDVAPPSQQSKEIIRSFGNEGDESV
jgi:hypothetical protein